VKGRCSALVTGQCFSVAKFLP